VHRARIHDRLGPRTRVAIGLVALCLLLASGRMNTLATDGSSQLAQAVHFCVTGHLAASHQITAEFSPKDVSSRSLFYDSNDIGGTALMLPAACLGAQRGATLWALAFLFSTGFLAYVKGTWDVLPAATAVAMLAWVAVRCRLGRDRPRRTLLLAALAVGLAGLCRYTLAPFLIVGAVAAIWPAIIGASRRERIEGAALLIALLVPDLVWNQIRTGRFGKPAEANPKAAFGHPHLTLHYLLSIFAVFFGIRDGLLFYAAVCLLGYACVVACIARPRGPRGPSGWPRPWCTS